MNRSNYVEYLENCKDKGEYANIDEIESLLDETNEVNMLIFERFPIKEVMLSEEYSEIEGSAELIATYNSLNIKKYDLTKSFDNIRYIGINEREEVILEFPEHNIKASGIYDFTRNFYDKFDIAKYANLCIKKNRHDLVVENIKEMLSEFKDEKNQYRFLIEGDKKHYLRAITTEGYKNYDNNVAIYLIFYVLEKITKENDVVFYVSNGFIGDSTMNVFFKERSFTQIGEVCKVNFEVTISNSELADEALKIWLRYKVIDNKERTFSAIMEEPLCRITHTMNIDTVENRLYEVMKLSEYESSIVEIIKTINVDKALSEDSVYYMLKTTVEKIVDTKDISKETKDKFKYFKENFIINNMLTLMEFFDRLSSIETDINERIFVERIFHQVIQDYSSIGM